MNMTPKSMSSNDSSIEPDNMVMVLNNNSNEFNKQKSNQANTFIKIKLEEFPEASNIIF